MTNAATGEQLYGPSKGHFHNTWEVAVSTPSRGCRGAITNHIVNRDTVQPIAQAGRTRWKAENESHNVLKAPRPVLGAERGYNVDHNFGHGTNNLAAVLFTLNVMAFVIHTVQQLLDQPYGLMPLRIRG